MKSVLRHIFALVSFMVPMHSFAQNNITDVLTQYAPTPKALSETRYGSLPIDLNSGTISMEIPIGTYQDQDFNLPISLRYSSSGFRPARPSDEAGLGWNLFAGGSVTREIVGIDDFTTGGYYWHTQNTNLYSSSSVYGLDTTKFIITNHINGDGSSYPSIDGTHETTSDIYHFSMPGYSGSFVINNNHQFKVYATSSGAKGTYSVTYDSDNSNSTFIIHTPDGMKWEFGSSEEQYREVMLKQNGLQEEGSHDLSDAEMSTVTWLLRKVTALDGRTLNFTYNTSRAKKKSVPVAGNDVITTFGRRYNKRLDTLGYPVSDLYKYASMVFTSYVGRIYVKELSGIEKDVARFSWEFKSYKEIYNASLFLAPSAKRELVEVIVRVWCGTDNAVC